MKSLFENCSSLAYLLISANGDYTSLPDELKKQMQIIKNSENGVIYSIADSEESAVCSECGFSKHAVWYVDKDNILRIISAGADSDSICAGTYADVLKELNKKKIVVKTLVIGNGVNQIPDGAFAGFTTLCRVIFGEDVSYIGKDSFKGCVKLLTFYFCGDYSTNLNYNYFGDSAPSADSTEKVVNENKKEYFFTIFYQPGNETWKNINYYNNNSKSPWGIFSSEKSSGSYVVAPYGEEQPDIAETLIITEDSAEESIDFTINCIGANGIIYELYRGVSIIGYQRFDVNLDALVIPRNIAVYNSTQKVWVSAPVSKISSGAFTEDNASNIRSITLFSTVKTLDGDFFSASSLEALYFIGCAPEVEGTLTLSDSVTKIYVIKDPSTGVEVDADTTWSNSDYCSKFGEKEIYEAVSKDTGKTYKGLILTLDFNSKTAIVGKESTTAGNESPVNTSGSGNGEYTVPDFVYDGNSIYMVIGFDRYAFYGSEAQKITFGKFIGKHETDSVPAVWDCTFRNMPKLKEFVVTESDKYMVHDGALYGKGITVEISYWVNDTEYETKNVGTALRLVRAPTTCTDFTVVDGCTVIDRYAFSGSNIKTVNVNAVTVIGSHAFYNCLDLSTVTGETINYIEDSAFENCTHLNAINLKETLVIGDRAFYGTDLGGTIALCGGVKYIGNSAFNNIDGISAFAFDPSGTGTSVYAAWNGILVVKIVNECGHHLRNEGCNHVGSYRILQCPSGFSHISALDIAAMEKDLNGSVFSIEAYAFEGCSNLESITLSDNVVLIGRNAFADCSNLRTFHFGKQYYGSDLPRADDTSGLFTYGIFENDIALNKITVSENNAYYTVDDSGVLYSRDVRTLYCYPAGVERIAYSLPEDTVKIYDLAFSGNTSLLRLIITSSDFNYVGSSAFADCSRLYEVYYMCSSLPNTGEKIYDNACQTLISKFGENVDLNGASSWNSRAVANYSNIEEVPNDVTDARQYIFSVVDTSGKAISGADVYISIDGVMTHHISDKNGLCAVAFLDFVNVYDDGVDRFEYLKSVDVKVEYDEYFPYFQTMNLNTDMGLSFIQLVHEASVTGRYCNDKDIDTGSVIINQAAQGIKVITSDSGLDFALQAINFKVAANYDSAIPPVGCALYQNGVKIWDMSCDSSTRQQLKANTSVIYYADVPYDKFTPNVPITAKLDFGEGKDQLDTQCELNVFLINRTINVTKLSGGSASLDLSEFSNSKVKTLLNFMQNIAGSSKFYFSSDFELRVNTYDDYVYVTLHKESASERDLNKGANALTYWEAVNECDLDVKESVFEYDNVAIGNAKYDVSISFTRGTEHLGYYYYRIAFFDSNEKLVKTPIYGIVSADELMKGTVPENGSAEYRLYSLLDSKYGWTDEKLNVNCGQQLLSVKSAMLLINVCESVEKCSSRSLIEFFGSEMDLTAPLTVLTEYARKTVEILTEKKLPIELTIDIDFTWNNEQDACIVFRADTDGKLQMVSQSYSSVLEMGMSANIPLPPPWSFIHVEGSLSHTYTADAEFSVQWNLDEPYIVLDSKRYGVDITAGAAAGLDVGLLSVYVYGDAGGYIQLQIEPNFKCTKLELHGDLGVKASELFVFEQDIKIIDGRFNLLSGKSDHYIGGVKVSEMNQVRALMSNYSVAIASKNEETSDDAVVYYFTDGNGINHMVFLTGGHGNLNYDSLNAVKLCISDQASDGQWTTPRIINDNGYADIGVTFDESTGRFIVLQASIKLTSDTTTSELLENSAYWAYDTNGQIVQLESAGYNSMVQEGTYTVDGTEVQYLVWIADNDSGKSLKIVEKKNGTWGEARELAAFKDVGNLLVNGKYLSVLHDQKDNDSGYLLCVYDLVSGSSKEVTLDESCGVKSAAYADGILMCRVCDADADAYIGIYRLNIGSSGDCSLESLLTTSDRIVLSSITLIYENGKVVAVAYAKQVDSSIEVVYRFTADSGWTNEVSVYTLENGKSLTSLDAELTSKALKLIFEITDGSDGTSDSEEVTVMLGVSVLKEELDYRGQGVKLTLINYGSESVKVGYGANVDEYTGSVTLEPGESKVLFVPLKTSKPVLHTGDTEIGYLTDGYDLSYYDLSVRSEQVVLGGITYLYVTVVNEGTLDAKADEWALYIGSGSLNLLYDTDYCYYYYGKDSLNNDCGYFGYSDLYSRTLTELKAGTSVTFRTIVDSRVLNEGDTSLTAFIIPDDGVEDKYRANNSEKVTVADMSTVSFEHRSSQDGILEDPSLTYSSGTFDPAKSDNISIGFNAGNGNSLSRIFVLSNGDQIGSISISTVSGSALVLQKDYLLGLGAGEYSILFEFNTPLTSDTGRTFDLTFRLTVKDLTYTATFLDSEGNEVNTVSYSGTVSEDSENLKRLLSYSVPECAGKCSGSWTYSESDGSGKYATGLVFRPVYAEHKLTLVEGVGATCTSSGVLAHYCCDVCGGRFADENCAEELTVWTVGMLEHDLTVDEAVPATCYSVGKTAGSHCSVCGFVHVAQTEIPMTGHTEVDDEGYDATCTHEGMTAGSHCSVCNKVFTERKVIPKADHIVIEVSEQAATCKESGHTAGTSCSVCGAVLSGQTPIPAAHVVEVIPGDAADCIHTGWNSGAKCSVCGITLAERTEVPALGHSYGAVTYSWSEDNSECTAIRECTHEGCTASETENATSVKTTVTAATCESKGSDQYTAVFENTAFEVQIKDVETSALGHAYSDAAYTWSDDNSTCTAVRNCTRDGCSGSESETVASIKTVITEPTCENKGSDRYTVVFDNPAFKTQIKNVDTSALGHDIVHHEAKAATCTEEGWSAYDICSRCGYASTEKVSIPKVYHTLVTDAAVPATCTATGLTEGLHCSVCGTVISAQEVTPVLPSAEVSQEGKSYTATVSNDLQLSSISIDDLVTKAKADPEVTLTVNTGSGTVLLDNSSVSSLRSADSKVSIVSLDKRLYHYLVGDAQVYEITFGDNHDNFNGTLTVTVDYDGPEDNLKVYYLADDQIQEKIDCTYADGKVTFNATHLSTYAVVSEKSDGGDDNKGICPLTIVAFLLMTLSVAAIPVIRYVRL